MIRSSNNVKKRVPRYSLILEKVDGTKYYYDFDQGTFIRMEENEVAPKVTLEKIDYLTSNFDSKEQLFQLYGITGPVKVLKITYQFNGEKKLAPAFGNKEWGELARTYKGQDIDFRSSYNNIYIFNEVYNEILHLNEEEDSPYADFLRVNGRLSDNTIQLIVTMVAHERATKRRYKFLYDVKDIATESFIEGLYNDDKDAFKEAFKRRMQRYSELRSAYLNYCKYFKDKKTDIKNKNNELEQPKDVFSPLIKDNPKPFVKVKKKPIEKAQQLSMFDL